MLGLGLSCYVEITAGGPRSEFGSVEILDGSRVRVTSGATALGQGHETAWSMIVADRLGVPMEMVDVVSGDTDLVARGGMTVGSRSVQIAGSVIAEASTQIIERARQLAANQLEANPDDTRFDADAAAFHVVGTPARSLGWADLAAAVSEGGDPLHAVGDFTASMPTFPFGAHLAVVDVDLDTGKADLIRLVAVDDAGRLLSPMMAEGQVHGGIAQGVGQALMELVPSRRCTTPWSTPCHTLG